MFRRQSWIVSICVVLCGGCLSVSSNNAVEPDPSSPASFDQLLGDWRLASSAHSLAGRSVTLAKEGDEFVGTYRGPGKPTTGKVILAVLSGGQTVVSFEAEPGLWVIGSVEAGPTSNTITVRMLDGDRVEADVDGSSVAGEVAALDQTQNLVLLTASGAELRAYFEANPQALAGERSVELVRP